MRVVAHGNVADYCAAHDMTIVERYRGKLDDYKGRVRVIVTDNCSDKHEFYYLKWKLMKRNITLLSTHWHDDAIADFVDYLNERRGEKRGGRAMFGYMWMNGKLVHEPMAMSIVRKIFELRDAGYTYKKIAAHPDVCYLDGSEMPLSTIQTILKNRSRYE